MRYRLTPDADADIARVLRQTRKLFGKPQVSIYADIIDRGIAMVAEDPSRPSCAERNEIRPGVKSFHLELVKRRRHSASHLLYFMEAKAADGATEIVVIGVVHENMEPKRKLSRILRVVDSEGAVDEKPQTGPR